MIRAFLAQTTLLKLLFSELKMNYVLQVLVVLFLAGLVNAQFPAPCVLPLEWHGVQVSIDPGKNLSVVSRISYDAVEERISLVEEVDITDKRYFYEYIFLFQEKTMYQIKLSINKTGECFKKPLDEPFHKFEIPRNATALTELTIGSNAFPEMGVNVNVFVGKIHEDPYMVAVTQVDCVPVYEVVGTKEYGAIHTSYYNIELGYDPQRFVPPEECKEVEA